MGNISIGLLPLSLFSLPNLSSLFLNNNQLVDPLPNHVSRLLNLNGLYLSSNLLNGTLPSWLFSLPSLVMLSLGETYSQGVFHLSASYSDHIPIMLTIQASSEVKRKRNISKRFEEKWASHPECRMVVEEGWGQRVEGGSPMFCFFQRIKNTRLALIKWEKRAFGNTKVILQQKQRLLEELTVGTIQHC